MSHEKLGDQEKLQAFLSGCKERGIKATHQRIEVFREVMECLTHPDADTVFEGVRKRMPSISRNTVYRTLWLLTDLGLARTLGQGKDRSRFDGNTSKHHHFVCEKCGKVLDFTSEVLDNLNLPPAVFDLGSVREAQVEVRGVCNDCNSTTDR